jgi:lipopolysaccharide transport system ATP-binding protein
VEDLSKRYRLRHEADRLPYRSLREEIARWASWPLQRLTGARTTSRSDFWALDQVNLEVAQGDVVGIIGRNGAGKTTLLKILSRITKPTRGRVRLRGRVGSLLEVGTGFHPELTGRENIYLHGAILGMNQGEVRKKFDEIVAFAELKQFLDTPVKRYSSGMYVRLAFAVSAHLEPDILLVDEVLAVGDAAFQKKCLGRMGEVAQGGRTILFVSHNMGAIRSLCPRVVWIEAGRIAEDGKSEQIISDYLKSVFQKGSFADRMPPAKSDRSLHIEKVLLKNDTGSVVNEVGPGDSLTVEIHYEAPTRFVRPVFILGVRSQFGPLFMANMFFDGKAPEAVEGKGILACTFQGLPLLPQTYTINLTVRGADGETALFPPQEVALFHVAGILRDYGLAGDRADMLAASATPLVIPYTWRMPDGREILVSGLIKKEGQ